MIFLCFAQGSGRLHLVGRTIDLVLTYYTLSQAVFTEIKDSTSSIRRWLADLKVAMKLEVYVVRANEAQQGTSSSHHPH